MENILSRDQLIQEIVYFGDDTNYNLIFKFDRKLRTNLLRQGQ